MNEKIEQLKKELEDTIEYSTERKGSHVVMDENGPAGFTLIAAIIEVLDAQAKEIEELKRGKRPQTNGA